MKQLTIINHYNDDKLTYNESTGRYELTIQYFKNNFDGSFKDDKTLQGRLKQNSRVIYYYINTHVASWNKAVVNFFLNHTEQGRQFLLEMLDSQMYADLQGGYNDLAYLSPINFNGQDKDREDIKRNTICIAAEQIFNDSDSYFGIRLDYHGQFPPQLFILARTYNS